MLDGNLLPLKISRFAVVGLLCLCLAACNRAAVRIYGTSADFPETLTAFQATDSIPLSVEISKPVDARSSHYGERVAGTNWTGCRTDPLSRETAVQVIQTRLDRELARSNLFAKPQTTPVNRLVLDSEIRAFCSQVVGFVYSRVAGIVSIRFSLILGDKIVWEKTIEHVVTDADPEYSGSQFTYIEQAMTVTMADSLRLVLRDLLEDIAHDRNAIMSSATPRAKD